MTQRERMLAIVAGGLSLVVVSVLAWNWVEGLYAQRRAEIRGLTVKIEDKEIVLAAQRSATRRLADYERRSLPANRELARALYQDWLLELVGHADLDDAKVNAISDHDQGGVLRRLAFSINGKGSIEQLTRFLYHFHQIDHLQQIRRLQIRPIENSRDLDIAVTIEALSLPAASRQDRLTDDPSVRLADTTIEQFQKRIVGRNLFSPPNHAPSLAAVGSKKVELGDNLSFDLKASDSDPLDTVIYALGDDAPAAASIDDRTGRVRWTPRAVGTYRFDVIARDDGLPAKIARQSVQVDVLKPAPQVVLAPEETPPPKLKFDVAKHTYLIGALEISGRREVWLHNRTTGKVDKLHQGDKLKFGSIEGVIARIGDGKVEIHFGDKRLLVAIGENLAEASILPVRPL